MQMQITDINEGVVRIRNVFNFGPVEEVTVVEQSGATFKVGRLKCGELLEIYDHRLQYVVSCVLLSIMHGEYEAEALVMGSTNLVKEYYPVFRTGKFITGGFRLDDKKKKQTKDPYLNLIEAGIIEHNFKIKRITDAVARVSGIWEREAVHFRPVLFRLLPQIVQRGDILEIRDLNLETVAMAMVLRVLEDEADLLILDGKEELVKEGYFVYRVEKAIPVFSHDSVKNEDDE